MMFNVPMKSSRVVTILLLVIFISACVTADCNIDSAGTKTYSTSDGLVITRVGVVATFRLGCDQNTKPPKLHAEVDDKPVAVVQSSSRPEFKSVSLVEDLADSKSRWIEIKVYDEESYQKLTKARESGSSTSYIKPIKTISVSHYGVTKGPLFKTETIATFALIGLFVYSHLLKSKISSPSEF